MMVDGLESKNRCKITLHQKYGIGALFDSLPWLAMTVMVVEQPSQSMMFGCKNDEKSEDARSQASPLPRSSHLFGRG
eukprot:scaffold4262_cov169-Amphora_coffeaeformis.AAC.4